MRRPFYYLRTRIAVRRARSGQRCAECADNGGVRYVHTTATCAGLGHGRDYSDCRASEDSESSQKPECLAHELSKILENKGQPRHVLNGEGFSTLTPHLEKHPGQIRITQDIPV